MDSIDQLKRLVFNGLLFSDTLDKLEQIGISVRPAGAPEKVIRIEEGSFSPTIAFQAAKMASIYVVFYCLENAVRDLIKQRLLLRVGIDWWDKAVPEKIKRNAAKIMEKEEKSKYHSSRGSSSIDYSMFGDLAQIIVARWEHFSDLFPDQHWISARFNDLELSRNVIMHTAVLPEIEIGRIESIARDWIRQVG